MTEREVVHPLDAAATEMFQRKGERGAVKVRRVLQLAKDLLGRPLDGARVLDLGCAEGVYSIEAGLRGARVLAIDGRDDRLREGRELVQRLGIANVEFRVADVLKLRRADVGVFDVVLFLGLQYHLDVPAVFDVVRNVHDCCSHVMILDTHVAETGDDRVEHQGVVYEGRTKREHDEKDDAATRQARLGASLENPKSFWFTKDSLLRLLHDVGFTSVLECHVPFEAGKRSDRITLAAIKGTATRLSSYPWLNDLSEEDIARRQSELPKWRAYWEAATTRPSRRGSKGWLGAAKSLWRGK